MSIFLIIAILTGIVSDDFELPPDIVYSTMEIRGHLLGFQTDDYIHVVILDEDRDARTFHSSDPLLNYFLACHVDENVTLNVEEVDTYLMEAEEMVHLLRVIGATAGGRSYSVWLDSLRAEGEPADLLGNYFEAPQEHLVVPGRVED